MGVRRIASVAAFALVAAFWLAGPRDAAAGVERFNGQLSVGYARLFVDQAPGGSFSISGGLSYPIMADLSLGASVGFHLLGSQTVERGSLIANLDYSLFEAALLAHWSPPGVGPLRISAGPALLNARAELSGGGAGFSDLAIEEIAPGAALDVTFMQRRPAPVRVGLEIGTRIGFLPEENWKLLTTRVTFHY